MSNLGRRLDQVEKRVVGPIPHDHMSDQGRDALIKAIFDESLAVAEGRQVERIESTRTDLSQFTLRLICNLAGAIRMPMECVLPNMFRAAAEPDTVSNLSPGVETNPIQGGSDGDEKPT